MWAELKRVSYKGESDEERERGMGRFKGRKRVWKEQSKEGMKYES